MKKKERLFRVFISYSRPEVTYAKGLKDFLEGKIKAPPPSLVDRYLRLTSDIDFTLSRNSLMDIFNYKLEAYSFLHNSITPGLYFKEVLENEIQQSDALVILWSQKSIFSDWIDFEIRYGQELGKVILPVIMDENAVIPVRLSEIQAVFAYETKKAILGRNQWMVKVKNALLSHAFKLKNPFSGFTDL